MSAAAPEISPLSVIILHKSERFMNQIDSFINYEYHMADWLVNIVIVNRPSLYTYIFENSAQRV